MTSPYFITFLRFYWCCSFLLLVYSINQRRTHRHLKNPSPSTTLPAWKEDANQTTYHHPSKKKTSTCCLIISIDNRPLVNNYDANHYPSMTAVLNHDYASYHGYDYLYYQNDLSHFIEETRQKYENILHDPMMDSKQPDKDIATAFHVGLKQFRAASWAKLPPLFFVHWLYHADYDYIWYIDSDAAISPIFRNRSIPEMMRFWGSRPDEYILKGQKNLSESSLIFFNNFPWRDNMPCAGSFLFKPSAYTDKIFRQWWDYNLPVKNFKHFHEQDALWHMIESEEQRQQQRLPPFYINSKTYTIMKEQQFPSSWTRYEDLWLVHIASYNYAYRMPILYQFLHLIQKDTTEKYDLAIQHIQMNHILYLKPLPICEEMERISSSPQQQSTRIKEFPPHNEATQQAWYDDHVSSSKITPLSLSELYEGRIVRRKGEFWIVENGMKRGFQNYQAFLELKIQQEWAHNLRAQDIPVIPDGPLIGRVALSTADKAHLLRYYTALPAAKSSSNADGKKISFKDSEFASYLYRPIPRNGGKSKTTSSSEEEGLDTRVIMYIISHNNETEGLVRNYLQTCCEHEEGRNWMYSLQITSTIFFESNIYQANLPSLQSQWISKDYVITATYKTLTKTLHYNQYTQSISSVLSMLQIAMDNDYDIIPFLRSGSGMMSFCQYWHGKSFSIAWYALLQAMGYSREIIHQYEEIKPFYRNIFIIKAKRLHELMIFMQRAIKIVSEKPEIFALLAVDAKYKEGKEEVAMRIFGTKYYQLFPFIFERLPSFFIAVNHYKICADVVGPCKYNS